MNVEMPDGTVISDVPDGVTQSELLRRYQKMNAPTETPSAGQSALIAGGGGLDRLAAGLKQGTRAVFGDTAVNAIDKAESALGMADSSALEGSQAGNKAIMQGLRQQQPVATFAGELPLAMAAKTPLGMAALGGLEYGTPQERAIGAGAGFIGGKAGEAIGSLAGRMATPIRAAGSEAIDATKALFDKYGIRGLPGQVTNSTPLKWAEQTLANLPGGGAIRAEQAAQQSTLNRAGMSAMGAPGDVATTEAVQSGKAALGAKFNSIPNGVTVTIDEAALNKLAEVEARYGQKLSADQRGIIKSHIDDILGSGGKIPGEQYQIWRSDIGKAADGASNGGFKSAMKGIQQALDGAFDRSAPAETVAAMKQTRGQWQAAKAMDKLSGPTGNLTPVRAMNAFDGMPGQASEVAQLAMRMRSLPQSGTMERLAYQSLLSGGLGAGGALYEGDPGAAAKYAGAGLLAPWAASQALTKGPLRHYLTNTLVTPSTEELLKRLGGVPGGLLGLRLAQ